MEKILDSFWINYGEFSRVGVEVYRNFIPNGVFVRVIGEFDVIWWVEWGLIEVGLGFRTWILGVWVELNN